MTTEDTGAAGNEHVRADAVADELPEELVITLRKPVTIGSGEKAIAYDKLVLREPTAAEMAQFLKLSGAESDVLAVSLISGVPKAAVEKIGARDLGQAARYIAAFLA